MPYAEFDTDIYFDIVADNLLKAHGQKALSMAGEALRKMQEIGDEEGYDLWSGVHGHLKSKFNKYYVPEGTTVH